MKLVDVINVRKIITAKATEKVEFGLAYKFAKLIKLTTDDEDFYNKSQREIFDRYAKKDDEGNVTPDENGRYQFDEDKVATVETELRKLVVTEVEIPESLKFTVEELMPLKFSVEEVMTFASLIKDDEAGNAAKNDAE